MYKFPVPHLIIFLIIELGKGKREKRKLREEILISSLGHGAWTTLSPAKTNYFPPLVFQIPQNGNSHMAVTTGFCITATCSVA